MAVKKRTTRASNRQTSRRVRITDGIYDRRLLGRVHRSAVARVQGILPALTLTNLLDVETFLQRMVDAQVLYGFTSAAVVPVLPPAAERHEAVLRELLL